MVLKFDLTKLRDKQGLREEYSHDLVHKLVDDETIKVS
jgi:hypothetical protein